MSKFQSVRGMHDVLPADEAKWSAIIDAFAQHSRLAGFGYIQTPVIEDADLFKKGQIGGELLAEEMYAFRDRSGNDLALRPEGTASVVRAYIEHGMQSLPKPVKLYYSGPMFRYDRPQAGRYRQFHQAGAELVGDAKPEADAQVIALLTRALGSLGLKEFTLQLNSIGDDTCRPKYIRELVDYYKKKNPPLCEHCKHRIKDNPLRLLDCKEKSCQPAKEEAPHIIDYLDKDCHDHFKSLLENLEELEIPYELNPYLVRGLDYYTRTTFEIWPNAEGGQTALASGGRYDGLVSALGGRPTPAVGFAAGIERLMFRLEDEKIEPVIDLGPSIYIAQIGDKARKACLKLHHSLLSSGISVAGCFEKESIKGQLKKASDMGAPYTLILGQKEVYDGTVIMRDMSTGAQEVFTHEKVVKELTKRLAG